MRHWYPYLAASIIALLIAIGVRHVRRERARRSRELEYSKALESYSRVLKTGMNRMRVESYLSSQNIPFRQLCCVSVKEFTRGVYDDTYDDLVKIGQEDVPWVCSANNVYVAFQFLGSRKDSPSTGESSDTLKDITIYHHLEGCL